MCLAIYLDSNASTGAGVVFAQYAQHDLAQNREPPL
jgi:hypothetical protein